jgi:hypothetical protein
MVALEVIVSAQNPIHPSAANPYSGRHRDFLHCYQHFGSTQAPQIQPPSIPRDIHSLGSSDHWSLSRHDLNLLICRRPKQLRWYDEIKL